jgi:ABC-type branched-subunit amino acid transport system ATPase component
MNHEDATSASRGSAAAPSTATAPAIEVRGLRKSYGEQLVLDDIDLAVAPGTVTALLGPNGAGKTTAVHILSTLVRPDAGSATVAGHDVVRATAAVRASIGLTGQFSAVDTLLTGEENLLLMGRLRHLGRRTAFFALTGAGTAAGAGTTTADAATATATATATKGPAS